MSKAIKVLISVAVIVATAVFLLIQNIDQIVESAIETVGSEVTGVSVTVDSVEISLQQGTGAIRGLLIGNPPGFKTDAAISIALAEVNLDTGSLSSDVIVVESVRVDSATVNFEQQAKGNNLQLIMDQLSSNTPSESSSTSDSGDDAIKLIVDQFDFLNATTTISVPALKQSKTVNIPDVRLSGIGRKTSGISASELAAQIIGPIVEKSMTAVTGISEEEVRQRVDQELDAAKTQGKEKATEKIFDMMN
jgi:uncharacterized protein involved in outer membrane biogenesis